MFLDADGKERNIRIDDPRADLTPSEVETAMNDIVAKNVFAGSALVSATKAYIITITTEEIKPYNQQEGEAIASPFKLLTNY